MSPIDLTCMTQYSQELCCEISYVASFLLCLFFFPVFKIVNFYIFFLSFSLPLLHFLPFLIDYNGKVLITNERPEAVTSSLSRDIP